MTESFGFFLAIATTWLGIGVALSIMMGRNGYNSFGWFVLGALLGPLGVVLAVDARRHAERLEPSTLAGRTPATTGKGPVDVLVGYDGSPESDAAMDAVLDILGDRLGRLTVATVVPFGDIREQERLAAAMLRGLAPRQPGRVPQLEVLHGHPSAALHQCAMEGGYELIAVGTRGAGLSKAIVGSAATELARDSKVPVLLVGGHQGPHGNETLDVA